MELKIEGLEMFEVLLLPKVIVIGGDGESGLLGSISAAATDVDLGQVTASLCVSLSSVVK